MFHQHAGHWKMSIKPKFGSCGSENGASDYNHFVFRMFGAHPDGAAVAPFEKFKILRAYSHLHHFHPP
jgi:hypothetical protein